MKGVAAELHQHEPLLWALCYRMTGCAADADNLVQETFLRAIERPPPRTDEPLRPWLVRVAMNLGRDALRRRKRRAYKGTWLPSPIETSAEPPAVGIAGEGGTERRYDLLESVSFAFLLALEALTPQQRAVLLLRDVFDYSVKETADALDLSEANVKTTHHRARRALELYDEDRCRPSPELTAATGAALERFVRCVVSEDVAAVEALLAEGVRSLSDGAGEFVASKIPIVGAARVARVAIGLNKHTRGTARYAVRTLNGLPALVVERDGVSGIDAPRLVLRCDVDAEGRISALHTVLATKKLTAVPRLPG